MAKKQTEAKNPVDLIMDSTGMTLEQIGKVTNVSWQSVQQWRKRGSIPARHIKKLASKTKVPRKLLAPELY